jgi:hypothetical protein
VLLVGESQPAAQGSLVGFTPDSARVAVEWEGVRLEVVDMDGRRIDKVLAQALPDADKTG